MIAAVATQQAASTASAERAVASRARTKRDWDGAPPIVVMHCKAKGRRLLFFELQLARVCNVQLYGDDAKVARQRANVFVIGTSHRARAPSTGISAVFAVAPTVPAAGLGRQLIKARLVRPERIALCM
jgi:hypothetical protein